MTTSEKTRINAAGAENTGSQDTQATTQSTRHADWISYAVAVTQQAAPASNFT